MSAIYLFQNFAITTSIVSNPKVRNNVCSNAFIQWCRGYKSISFYIKLRQIKTVRGESGREGEGDREKQIAGVRDRA
jgi:hypothetical protein